ncbi:hypothetical protein F511_38661 [Dorcoceras hygrometricum]|uniref:Uncharacterized protein n=1 Tax=Dorcoceras hygrometricum TaxID=472368 RepID=A0A2Z7BHB1_9LAMI|nr:hypothetical protein F511_38661 [Dorcoceras hygrometricum]
MVGDGKRESFDEDEVREALSIVYNRNQTRVDIEICGLSERWCPPETKVLEKRFLREFFETLDHFDDSSCF